MSFISFQYAAFLLAAVLVYYLLPGKAVVGNSFLLAASYFFYICALPQYTVFLLFSTAVTYFAALLTEGSSEPKQRKTFHIIGIVLNLSVLFIFKYYNFFMESLCGLLALVGVEAMPPAPSLAVPLGISFYTFTTLGYQIDVYNGKVKAERNFITYSLFAGFFPQLLSGPIARAKDMLPQYREARAYDFENLKLGFGRFALGLFKKAVVADWLLRYVDSAWSELAAAGGPEIAAAVLVYTAGLYFDFSAYSDMAIGSGKMLGLTLNENFAAPLLAENMSGLWSRWHMSLTGWLQDYIFTPLVWGNWWNRAFHRNTLDERQPEFAANIIIVFLISGLWHGASWTFVVWGLWQGVFRCAEELLHRWRKRPKKLGSPALDRLRRASKTAVVYLIFSLGLVFFRAASFNEAFAVFSGLLRSGSVSAIGIRAHALVTANTTAAGAFPALLLVLLALSFALLLVFDIIIYNSKTGPLRCYPLAKLPPALGWVCYFFMALSTLAIGCFGGSSFIYFRF